MKRWIREAAEYLHALIAVFKPIGPKLWLPAAYALSRSSGWMPSMLLVAMFGATMFVNNLIFQWINGPVARVMSVATWLTWGLVSCLAMSMGSTHAVRNVRRLGLRSILRFRLWFELGRLAWHAMFLGVVLAASVAYVGSALNVKQIEAVVWPFVHWTVEPLLVSFAMTGAIGYILAVSRWRIPSGRGFECVNFFLPLGASIYLLIYVIGPWPPVVIWPDGVITVLVGSLAFSLIIISFLITVYRMQKSEART